MAEVTVHANGVQICTEAFGSRDDPCVLLVMGAVATMLRWDEVFCSRIAARGRYVVRFDHRDAGRSSLFEPGDPPYTMEDMAADVIGVLDALDLARAHLVGMSMGGMIAQLTALRHPQRVTALTLIATTCDPFAARSAAAGSPIDGGLPGPTAALLEAMGNAQVQDPEDPAFAEQQVELYRALSGSGRRFDEAAEQQLTSRELDRAVNYLCSYNHELAIGATPPWRADLGDLHVPTLVVHGSQDPMMPVAHGIALSEEISGAELLLLDGAGHEVHRGDWDVLIDAIVRQTGTE